MSLANGHMGFRGNFEEDFTGRTLKGTYIAGVYYPDKTRVGWWKNGYPEYFVKVLNACDVISIRLRIDNETIDLNRCLYENLSRELSDELEVFTKGVSRMDSQEVILRHGNLQDEFTDGQKKSLAEKKNRIYVEMISKFTPDNLLPGVIGLMEE